MYSNIVFRNGEEERLAIEFLGKYISGSEGIKKSRLDNISCLNEELIMAVHYVDAGGQGDSGCVEIIYCSNNEIQVLYGNYVYGGLNIDKVYEKLPMLISLDTRNGNLPYPFGGSVNIPKGWNYVYMGVMNHFFCRDIIADNTRVFVSTIVRDASWALFDAIAWFCGCNI